MYAPKHKAKEFLMQSIFNKRKETAPSYKHSTYINYDTFGLVSGFMMYIYIYMDIHVARYINITSLLIYLCKTAFN